MYVAVITLNLSSIFYLIKLYRYIFHTPNNEFIWKVVILKLQDNKHAVASVVVLYPTRTTSIAQILFGGNA